ncbi:MAG: 16S rRNA (guanine(527)-N(7))-methyltransferase RsmG [Ezakiella sp.]|nr:16S rRNA (guanine(527)-N(7))-methyltransferase RsmG [Ezakiella sp.]
MKEEKMINERLAEKKQLIDKYLNMIIQKNKVMNLTAIDDYDEMWQKHVIDSASVLPFIEKYNIKSMIDVGTGAGFPGMIIKILKEDLDIMLLDSLNKRIKFLDEVILGLDLKNIKTIHSRAEDYARKEGREKYDLSISRAVARLNTLLEYNLPFVKVGGIFIAMKGPGLDEELDECEKALKTLGGEVLEVKKLEMDFGERNILIVKKINKTPKNYPRVGNKPKTNPL